MEKSKKIEVDGVIVRQRKQNVRRNNTVLLPDKITWINQPNLVTLMSCDFTIMQHKVVISLIEKLQYYIEESIKNVPNNQLSLFKEHEDSDKISIQIQYKDLGIQAKRYPILKDALRQLASLTVELDTKDPITGADSWAVKGLFNAYIPNDKYNRGFTIQMDKDIAEKLITVPTGFTKYIKEIAFNAQSKYTIRLYMLISSWKDKGGFQIRLDNFRKWLRIENKYQTIQAINRWILKPVYDELYEKSNCWFEYKEIYRKGETQPYKLSFKVIQANLTAKQKEILDSQINTIHNLCFSYLKMEDKHFKNILPLINITNTSIIIKKITDLITRYQDHNNKITDIAEYSVRAIRKEFEFVEGVPGEERE